MPGPQGDQPVIVVNMADYPALRDAKAVKLVRLQADHYQLTIRKFDPQTGKPATPDVLPLTRDGAKDFAGGIASENAQLQARIDSNNRAIANLTGALVADMDELDKAALAAGDI